jgi:hypothetical protein
MGEEVVERRDETSRRNRASDAASAAFEHAIVENETGLAECTIFPRDCDDTTIRTHWLTAAGDSFVALETVR